MKEIKDEKIIVLPKAAEPLPLAFGYWPLATQRTIYAKIVQELTYQALR